MAAALKLKPSFVRKASRTVLGRDFDLSVTYISSAAMRKANRATRGINKPTDILSFPFSKKSGEILICLPEVTTHARAFSMTADEYLPYLFIHGLVHLKGHDHGRIMDKLEQKFCNALRVSYPRAPEKNGTTNRSGNRRGHLPGARRGVEK